jgi:hypothetical protein
MFSMKRIRRAGLIAAACGLVAVTASARTNRSETTSQAGESSGDKAASRQHLAAAQQALADLTKLPAAAQLQGDQRTMIAKFIGDFNAFATATSDWRGKYQVVDESLNKIIEDAANAPPAPPAGATTAPGAPAPEGPLDATIVEKLKQMRTELSQFEITSGDPVFMVKAINKILTEASSGGSVTLNPSQLQEVQKYLETIRAAAMH